MRYAWHLAPYRRNAHARSPSRHTPDPQFPLARDTVHHLRASRIREVANAGIGLPTCCRSGSANPTRSHPTRPRRRARALAGGATFYTHNLGIAPLRGALADYVGTLHGATRIENVAVTSAGVNGLMLAAQLIAGPGDRVVAVTPLWPNLVEIPKILGASVETVSLDYGPHGWTLDVDKLLAALTRPARAR